MKKRITSVLLIMVLVITMFTPLSFAATKTKKMTLYDVVKSGSAAYVGTNNAIYKVNLKSGKVVKFRDISSEEYSYFEGMRLYKGYLYYKYDDDSLRTYLYRSNVKTKKAYKLASVAEATLDFAISKSKIYYYTSDELDNHTKKVMKLNGKSKKKSSYKVVNSYKHSNAKGYKLIIDTSNYDFESESGYVVYRLKTPKKTIYLDTISSEDYSA